MKERIRRRRFSPLENRWRSGGFVVYRTICHGRQCWCTGLRGGNKCGDTTSARLGGPDCRSQGNRVPEYLVIDRFIGMVDRVGSGTTRGNPSQGSGVGRPGRPRQTEGPPIRRSPYGIKRRRLVSRSHLNRKMLQTFLHQNGSYRGFCDFRRIVFFTQVGQHHPGCPVADHFG